MDTGLSAHQRAVVDRFLDDRAAERRHVVVSLSGAHAYGFPSPDSDVDLKCVHAAPIRDVLAFRPFAAVADRVEVIEGVEVDYGSNELGAVLGGVLRGNGNFIERLLGPLPLREGADLADLRPLVRQALSRRVHHHFRRAELSR